MTTSEIAKATDGLVHAFWTDAHRGPVCHADVKRARELGCDDSDDACIGCYEALRSHRKTRKKRISSGELRAQLERHTREVLEVILSGTSVRREWVTSFDIEEALGLPRHQVGRALWVLQHQGYIQVAPPNAKLDGHLAEMVEARVVWRETVLAAHCEHEVWGRFDALEDDEGAIFVLHFGRGKVLRRCRTREEAVAAARAEAANFDRQAVPPGVRVFFHDSRPAPEDWILTRTATDTIALLTAGNVARLSLDPDPGEKPGVGTGYDVLTWIEEQMALRDFDPPTIRTHGSYEDAVPKMRQALERIHRLVQEKDIESHGGVKSPSRALRQLLQRGADARTQLAGVRFPSLTAQITTITREDRERLKPREAEQEAAMKKLLTNARRAARSLGELWEFCGSHWGYEDPIYRFWYGSFKVYWLQTTTLQIVAALQALLPERQLNADFLKILDEGTGRVFMHEDNDHWAEATRPVVDAFFHARYFLEMAVRYARELKSAPHMLPSGWAGLLCLYDLR